MSSSPGQDDIKVSRDEVEVSRRVLFQTCHTTVTWMSQVGKDSREMGWGHAAFLLVALGQATSRCGGPAMSHRAALKITPPHLLANWDIMRDSPLTHIADEVVGTVGLPSNHS